MPSMVKDLTVELLVDQKEIALNEFVEKIVKGVVVGAVTSLRDINEDWKEIKIKVTR
jgi:hypothetical protein